MTALRATGRLENVDAGLVALCRVLADETDEAIADVDESRYTVGTIAGRYHAALTHLLARPVSDDRDLIADLFANVEP